jgi:hypothetical protein
MEVRGHDIPQQRLDAIVAHEPGATAGIHRLGGSGFAASAQRVLRFSISLTVLISALNSEPSLIRTMSAAVTCAEVRAVSISPTM